MVGMDLRTFTATLDAFERVPRRLMGKVQRKLVLDALGRLVDRSPVGNTELWATKPPPGYVGGRFKGNWQVTVGPPADDEVNAVDGAGAETKARGAAKVAVLPPFAQVWVTNNVPYAERLEEGHSSQAPAGSIWRLTFEEAVQGYSSRAAEVLREEGF